MAQSVEQKLVELYLSNLELIGEGFPASFNRGRHQFAESLRLGDYLPVNGDERYHLADISGLYARDWEYYFTQPAQPVDGATVCEDEFGDSDAFRIEINNGFTDSKIDENGLIYGSLRTAAREYEDIVNKYFNSAIKADENISAEPVAGLNSAFVQDGAFLYLPDGVKAERPVVIDCRYAASQEDIACFTRMLLVFGKDSGAQVVILHRGSKDAKFLINSVCEVIAEEGAQVKISLLSSLNDDTSLLHSNFVKQSGQSDIETVSVMLNGELSRLYHKVDLLGEGALTKLNGLYLADADSRISIGVQINHMVPLCNSTELIKGIASGRAEGSFTGRVYVAPGAQRTQAMQQSRNIELSPDAKIYTRPQLEIYADDVKCSHGATVGQLDGEAIYYMRQRGIDLRTARRLQLEGFVRDVTLHYDYGREFFDRMVDRKMEGM